MCSNCNRIKRNTYKCVLCVAEVEETQRKETDECMKRVLVSLRKGDGYELD